MPKLRTIFNNPWVKLFDTQDACSKLLKQQEPKSYQQWPTPIQNYYTTLLNSDISEPSRHFFLAVAIYIARIATQQSNGSSINASDVDIDISNMELRELTRHVISRMKNLKSDDDSSEPPTDITSTESDSSDSSIEIASVGSNYSSGSLTEMAGESDQFFPNETLGNLKKQAFSALDIGYEADSELTPRESMQQKPEEELTEEAHFTLKH